jgi:hypothetical protein
VAVEVDAQGLVHYVFKEVRAMRAAAGTGVRVDASGAGAEPPASTEEAVREKVDREFEQLRKLKKESSGP